MNQPMDAIDQLRADYDATPYHSDSVPQSAPGPLAAIAHLFGLDAPDVSRARVLAIGCAAGGNLLPFAVAHPEARVVGVDLSHVQIEQGCARVSGLGLDTRASAIPTCCTTNSRRSTQPRPQGGRPSAREVRRGTGIGGAISRLRRLPGIS